MTPTTRNTAVRRFRAYPAYKDSGVEWLGEIPAHWEARRLRHACARITDGSHYSPPAVIGGLPYVTVKDLVDGHVDLAGAAQISEVDFLQLVRNGCRPHVGDVLFSKDGTVGKVALVERDDFVVLSSLAILGPSAMLDGNFLRYFLASASGAQQIESKYAGAALRRITLNVIVDLVCDLPPVGEQRAIAAFLDREAAKIDALIAKKARLNELLQEKRSALITQAVTKGLDLAAAMKDSGVEWLGEMPAHWEVKRLKFLVAVPLAYGAGEAAELTDPDLPRYIRITDIREDGSLRDDTFRSIPEAVAEPYLLADGDVLFARSGATVGKTFRYEPAWGIAAYAGYLIKARFDKRQMLSRFAHFFTQTDAYWDWLRSNLIQATIQNVSAEKYASLAIPVPPPDEQTRISGFIESETAEIDLLVAKVRAASDRLKEFRAALISAAVTGKIDVREDAA